jgi:hypothetical protein
MVELKTITAVSMTDTLVDIFASSLQSLEPVWPGLHASVAPPGVKVRFGDDADESALFPDGLKPGAIRHHFLMR